MFSIKKSSIILIIFSIIVFFIFPLRAYADTIDDTFKGADSFVSEGKNYNMNTSKLNNTSKFLYNTLLAIGLVVSVIVGLFLGIRYMTSAAYEKAEVKELFIPYIISCCLIFGAFTIWKLVINALK